MPAIDYFVWAAFAVEYGVKLYLSPSRRRFFTGHLVDLAVVVLPMLRPLRAVRLLRPFGALRAGAMLANALSRTGKLLAHRGLRFVLLAVLAIVPVAAALAYAFEAHTPKANIHGYIDALWWAIVTVTTIGYGDRYPVSAGGRGVAVALMLVGIGLIGVLTATVASYFVESTTAAENEALTERLDHIEQLLATLLARAENQPGPQHADPDGAHAERANDRDSVGDGGIEDGSASMSIRGARLVSNRGSPDRGSVIAMDNNRGPVLR